MTSSAKLAAVLRDPERLHLRAGTVATVSGGRVSVDLGGVVIPDLPVVGFPVPSVGARAVVLVTPAQAVVLPSVAQSYEIVQSETTVSQAIIAGGFSGTGVGHAFVAPPSGVVKIDYYHFISLDVSTTASQIFRQAWGSFRVGTGDTVGGGDVILSPSSVRSISLRQSNVPSSMNGRLAAGARYVLTGLIPGDTYNIEGSTDINFDTNVTALDHVQRFSTEPHLG